jgi:hypothetical protein
MNRLNLQFNDSETKILLLWLHAVSEIHWTDAATSGHMQELSERIQQAVSMQMPHLKSFNEEKNAPIEEFV